MPGFETYTEETAPAADDVVLIRDTSGGDTNKVQVKNLNKPPFQWLVGNKVNGSNCQQVIPDDVWVPLHLESLADTTTGRPTPGSSSVNVAASVTLTPYGSHTIEIDTGGIETLALRSDAIGYLIVQDTTDNQFQVVRYTGTSDGGAGNDSITGVSLGSWSLTSGTRYNVRQASPWLIDPYDHAAALGRYYLACTESTVGWVPNGTGVRSTRMASWFNFIAWQHYIPFSGNAYAGSSTGVPGVEKAPTSITNSTTTATLTSAGHGHYEGETIRVQGATPSEYNGTFTISNVTTNTFDYTMSGDPGGNATVVGTYTHKVQTVNDYYQPGYTADATGGPDSTSVYSTIEVYQSSGGDLGLTRNGPLSNAFPAYTCVFQGWLEVNE